jgi:hypothetical protein
VGFIAGWQDGKWNEEMKEDRKHRKWNEDRKAWKGKGGGNGRGEREVELVVVDSHREAEFKGDDASAAMDTRVEMVPAPQHVWEAEDVAKKAKQHRQSHGRKQSTKVNADDNERNVSAGGAGSDGNGGGGGGSDSYSDSDSGRGRGGGGGVRHKGLDGGGGGEVELVVVS